MNLGCDYTVSFNRKAKLRSLKLLKQENFIQEVFGEMGVSETVAKKRMKVIETFVCNMYGYKKETDINYFRLEMFL